MSRFTHPAYDGNGISSLLPFHAQFISLQTQQATLPNVTQAVMFETTIYSQGIAVTNGTEGYPSRVNFENPGVYNIAFSGQLHNTGGGGSGQDIFMWFRKNGVNIPDSNTRLTVSTNSPYTVAAWNIFVSVEAGDYVELVGHPNNAKIVLEHVPATNGTPGIPSVIMTVNQVG